MTPNLDLEIKVIGRFIVKSKRDRYLTFLQSDKTRNKFTNLLAHFRDLRLELFEKVKSNERQIILERVNSLGKLKDCYLISESSKLDQEKLGIDSALNEVIGSGIGTLIVFGDAEIVYYESENPSDRWLSK
jgi:hypothetical protein